MSQTTLSARTTDDCSRELTPVKGNSLSDLAYCRALIKTLFDSGDIAGALNLMISSRGLVEQAHALAIEDGKLLGPFAAKRLATELMEIITNSLEPVKDNDLDAYCDIIDGIINRMKSTESSLA